MNFGDIPQYIPTRLWNSIEFAKKVFENGIDGSVLKYFSNEIRNDPDICRMTLLSGGFHYMSDSFRQNKEVILEVGDRFEIFRIIEDINKELIEDEDIIKAYWEDIAGNILGESCDLFCLCSIIRNR